MQWLTTPLSNSRMLLERSQMRFSRSKISSRRSAMLPCDEDKSLKWGIACIGTSVA